MALTTNGIAALSRELEAQRLADLLRSYGMGSFDAERMDEGEWEILASIHGQNPPSEETRARVIQELKAVAL